MRAGTRPCPRCRTAMVVLRPASHDRTEVDQCAACALVWFDPLEFDGLDRVAWVQLLLATADAQRHAEQPAPAGRWSCPDCAQPLQAVQGVTRHGRHGGLACPQGHGHVHGVGALLASRGLLRAPDLAERAALGRRGGSWPCLSCGAPVAAADEHCRYCTRPVLCIDVPRLALALGADDEAAAAQRRPASADAPAHGWSCHGCGQLLDPTSQPACPHCGLALQSPRLADLQPLLLHAQQRLQRLQDEAMQRALQGLPVADRLRVAGTTRRPEHQAAAQRAEHRWWQRWALIAGGFGLALLVAFCNAR